MKPKHRIVGLLTCGSLSVISLIAPVSAQCVQSHTGVQTHIGRETATQTHDVEMKHSDSCVGNYSSSTSSQTNLGGSVRQHQEIRHETTGNSESSNLKRPTVSVETVTPIQVKTPQDFPY